MIPALVAAAVVLVGAGLVRAVVGLAAGGELGAEVLRWRLPAPAPVQAALADAAVPMAADDAWTAWVGVLLAAVVGGVRGGVALALVLGAAVAVAPVLALTALRGRADRLVDAALPAVLDAVARALRSGATLPQAVDEARARAGGRLASDLAKVVHETANGFGFVASLDRWAERCPTPGVRLVVGALALGAESGGGAARAVDGVAATLRADQAVAGELRAQSAQARLSALVIALAPLGFGALATATDARTARFLLRTPVGAACLAAGIGLDGVGAWWMQRITAAVS